MCTYKVYKFKPLNSDVGMHHVKMCCGSKKPSSNIYYQGYYIAGSCITLGLNIHVFREDLHMIVLASILIVAIMLRGLLVSTIFRIVHHYIMSHQCVHIFLCAHKNIAVHVCTVP